MNRLTKFIAIIFILFIIWEPKYLESCTAFCLKKEGNVLIGKNLDWPIGDGFILINKKGMSKFLFGLHYFVCDRFGNTAVIEFIDGEVLCFNGDSLPIAVLSNNSYQNSIKYLKFHKGFGGDRIPKNGPESQERFVRAALLIKNYVYDDNSSPTEFAFSILDNVKQNDTQWSIIYDPVNLTTNFKMKSLPAKRSLNFINIDFSDNKTADCFVLGNNCTSNNLFQCFSEFSEDTNKILLEIVFNKLVHLEEMDKTAASILIDKLLQYQQTLEK